jgi:hypothetical protein
MVGLSCKYGLDLIGKILEQDYGLHVFRNRACPRQTRYL